MYGTLESVIMLWHPRNYCAIIIIINNFGVPGIRGQMRSMATLPQGHQEQLVVKAKLEDPQVSLG